MSYKIKTHNKLVRDNVIDNILRDGKDCTFIEINDDYEFTQAIFSKVVEELNELRGAKTHEEKVEELADVNTALHYLFELLDVEPDEVFFAMLKKRQSLGAFEKRIFLQDVLDI